MPCYHPIQAHLMVLCNWGSIGKEGRGLAIGPGTRVYKTRARCVVGLRPAAKMPIRSSGSRHRLLIPNKSQRHPRGECV
jgi:hypothetical protein